MIPPVAQARDDYDIFSGLAARMDVVDAFTEGHSATEWIETRYAAFEQAAQKVGIDVPDWETLKAKNAVRLDLDPVSEPHVPFGAFRTDPNGAPLGTPSGKVEIFSAKIASFGYESVPGHPTWMPPDVSAQYPLRLVSPQPSNKLHSQLQSAIADGADGPLTEVEMHPEDAAVRELHPGDIVRVQNKNGICIARLALTDDILRGVVAMQTGAWFRPGSDGTDLSGNPNTLTSDQGTSPLGQGSAAHNVGVEVMKSEPKAEKPA
jgi:biotin/methionine sulfoxide reductase